MPRRFTATSHWARNIDAAPVTAAPLTMACWYRPQGLGAAAVLMQLGDYTAGTADNKFRMLKSSGNQLQFIAATTSATTLTNTQVTMAANTWYHCLVSANATYSPNRAVIDGVVATLASANRVPTGVNSLAVGVYLYNTTTYAYTANGDICWPAVWNAQLTAEEERALAEGISPRLVRPQSLAFFAEEDDQRRIWEDAIAGRHLSFSTGADTAQYIPDIPAPVRARMQRRTARIYAFASGGTQSGAGSSAGSATAAAVGASTAAADGTSAGSATAAGVGASTAEAAGAAAGSATVSGVGASTAEAVGTAAGSATASAVGDVAGGVQSGAGTSAGTSTAAAVGASTAAGAGSSAGVATASAVGVDASAETPESASLAGLRVHAAREMPLFFSKRSTRRRTSRASWPTLRAA